MAAEPADPGNLEARVTRLEQRAEQETPFALASLGYGLSLLHHDVREIRRQQDADRLVLHDLQATQGAHTEILQEHGDLLRQILRRLPPPPGEPGNTGT